MEFLTSLVPTLIVLGLLILIHEVGHFIACRLLGVEVEKFSIGFGPEVLHWQGKRTRYAISILPLGGFVKPAGESVTETEGGQPKPGDYLAAPLYARILIVVAGVIMNYVLAFLLFAAVFLMGRPVPGTTIGTFIDGYPAKTSGLEIGDKIIAVNDRHVTNWTELTGYLSDPKESPLNLAVERKTDDQRVEIVNVVITPKDESMTDVFGEKHDVRRIGITPHPEANKFERYGFFPAIYHSGKTVVEMAVLTHQAIFYLIAGKMSLKTLAGPIGIVALTGSAAQLGIPYVLQLAATLSVSLAVINLLPIPALDGGHFLFLLIEAFRRKPVSLQFQERATQVGFVLLMMLMVFVVYNDIVNLDVYGRVLGFFKHGSS